MAVEAAIVPRKSHDTKIGGRGGAGNTDGTVHEYVDGGLYRTDSPGANGQPYSVGRGGAGNMGKGDPDTPFNGQDNYSSQSVMHNHQGIASGGRGGAGNIGEIESVDNLPSHAPGVQNTTMKDQEVVEEVIGREKNPHLEKRRLSNGYSHLGLADKLKYGLLSMVKKS